MILRAERYLKLDVAGHQARMVVSLTLGPEEGRRVLSAADGDEDGRVTTDEANAYLAQWGEGLRTELPLSVDEDPLVAAWGDGYFEPIGAVRATPLTVEMVARFELEGGEQTVRFEDRMVRREVFERTDVAFDVRDGAELLESGVNGEADGPTPDLMYGGTFRAGQPVPLYARLRTPAPEPAPEGSMLWRWGGAVVAIALGLLVTWIRRRRQNDEARPS
ncbi:MAG: hypothetical protein KC619_28865 [Myxococcales bacterium]|nr:hypothetical protein [Myxococcales bacterium]